MKITVFVQPALVTLMMLDYISTRKRYHMVYEPNGSSTGRASLTTTPRFWYKFLLSVRCERDFTENSKRRSALSRHLKDLHRQLGLDADERIKANVRDERMAPKNP